VTGRPLAGIASVASFFVSRVDAKADARLSDDSPHRGKLGIANARAAYARYEARFAGSRWQRLADLGARPQRPLWASTATKDPSYRDVVYLEQLALPGTILTVPEPTLRAFADHGDPHATEPLDPRAVEQTLDGAVDLPAITSELEREGIEAFCDSYRELLVRIEQRAHRQGTRPRARRAADRARRV
jgi:transaldolase